MNQGHNKEKTLLEGKSVLTYFKLIMLTESTKQ